jgi:hypothetical protein
VQDIFGGAELQGDHQARDLRTLSRELAALRLQISEDRISGAGDELEIARLGRDIDELAGALRRMLVDVKGSART